MEEDLKILKVEYLSNHWSELPHKFWINFRGPNKRKQCLKWRRPPMEDNLKILNADYLSNHWLDLPQISNLGSGDHTRMKDDLNEDDLQWKMTSKY